MIDNVVDPAAESGIDCVNDAYTLYELQFYRSDNPPDPGERCLCTDGLMISRGYHDGKKWLYDANGLPWPGVRAWAELPDPNECMIDCYPDRTCRICGCTQDHACEGGCYWIEWDLCSACAPETERS
jgi:hypothetical protein